MKVEDLRLDELVTFGEGSIDLHGRHLVLHSIQAMAQLRKDLAEMLGWENARRVLTRFGLFWGRADGMALRRILRWSDPVDHLKATLRFMSLAGVGDDGTTADRTCRG